MPRAKTRCRVCRVENAEVDGQGRCLGCRMALWATREGRTYGAVMARLWEDGIKPETFDFCGLPPVRDNRPHSRYGI